jgi:hypothetical protein
MSTFDEIKYWFEIKFFTGEEILGHWILLLLLLATCAAYVWFCFHMRSVGVGRRVGIPYFFLFVTDASWLLGFLSAPSEFSVWLMFFQLLAAPLLLLACAIALAVTRGKSVYDWIALVAGFAYPAALVFLFATGIWTIKN